MEAVKASVAALEQDEINQLKKYGGEEPSGRSARFAVELPRTPQHEKYSLRRNGRAAVPTAMSSATKASVQLDERLRKLFPGGIRFNKRTLRAMFKEIDRDSSGDITQRELIIALRQHKSLLAMFALIQGAEIDDCLSSHHGLQREEVYRIKEILKEVDTDGNGTMEWAEFVEFFRRAGLLLEYKTQRLLNRTTLCAGAGTATAGITNFAYEATMRKLEGHGEEDGESEDAENFALDRPCTASGPS